MANWTRALLIGRESEAIAELIRQELPDLELLTRGELDVAAADLLDQQMLLAFNIPERLDGHLGELRWIQSFGAGVDGILGRQGLAPDVLITRVTGVFGERIAEWVLARSLVATQSICRLFHDQRQRRWRPIAPASLAEQQLLVLGVGEIGAVVCRRLAALGPRITGVNRTGQPVDGVLEVIPIADLDPALEQADQVVLLLPITSATRSLLDRDRLARMKPGAWLLNAGRGALVDEQALIEALKSRHLGGACLDVFVDEPLSPTSELWGLENVLISPHVAGVTTAAEAATAFVQNWKRLAAGERVTGLVDRQRGY